MAKNKKNFVCKECGYNSPKWTGCCPNCGGWNTFEEEVVEPNLKGISFTPKLDSYIEPKQLRDIDVDDELRYKTGINSLDQLFGGGIVKGSLSLLGGDPGIGKSTLLLQICSSISKNNKILYVSGEESAKQLKLRADRLNVKDEALYILSEADIGTVTNTILTTKPDIVMIDSIQTMNLSEISSASGSVMQVRECTYILQKIAKEKDISIIIVGHVNKDGNIAGPKILEHIVDVVLYFEGETNFSFRILRVVKNRFGSTNEIAVFEMLKEGLKPVDNPSAMLLSERPKGVSGSCVCSVIEGTRPILAEVQSLVTKSGFGMPRRMCKGFDYNRMSLMIAVLEKRAGYLFGALDCYINVIGGIKLDEPGVDLAICLSLVSSLRDKPLDDGLIAIGEVGLAGEIRSIMGANKTILEANKLGFNKVILPKSCINSINYILNDVKLIPVNDIKDAINKAFNE